MTGRSGARAAGPASGPALVWDLPVRVFHWLLLVGLVGSWITAEAGFDWTETHFVFGYMNLGLIGFRLVWGFAGTRHARFSGFLKGPATVARYTLRLLGRRAPAAVGHNPLGGWMVIVLLLLVAVQAVTGLFISDDIFYAGPYNGVVSGDTADRLAGVHHLNFRLIQIAVAVHVAAVAFHAWRHRDNLVRPMITGYKTRVLVPDDQAISGSSLGRALLVALLVAAGVTALVMLAPPPPLIDYY